MTITAYDVERTLLRADERQKAAFVRSLERIRVAAERHRSLNMLVTREQHAVDHAAYLLYSALDAHRSEFGP